MVAVAVSHPLARRQTVSVEDLAGQPAARPPAAFPPALREALVPANIPSADARAGLHPAVLEYAADRKIALLGSDGNNDTAPSTVQGVDFPVHVLAIAALGVHLIDYLDFSALAPLCAEFRQWSFLCVVAPLRLALATGSPVNPIAIL